MPSSFARLVGSNLAAQSAEQLSLAAVPMVAVLALDAGAGEIGLLGAAQTLPFLLFSIPFGVLADRGPRLRLLLASEMLRALALAALLALVLLPLAPPLALLGLLGFAGAVGTVGFSVAAPALLPGLVPASQLARANGRMELARSAAFAGGPALAGALVGAAGAPAVFVLATLLSCAAVALLWRIEEPALPTPARRHPWHELQEGAGFVWRHPLLRPVLLTAVAWNIAWFVLQAAYLPYALRALGLGPGAAGLTLAACGAGMVCGALAAPRLLAVLPFGRAIQFGPVVSVLAALTMLATLAVPQGWLAAVSFFLFGAGPILWAITSTTLRQRQVPAALLGRASALYLTANAGARPLGAALGAGVGSAAGEEACLWLSAAGFLVQAAVILASPLGRLDAADGQPPLRGR